MTLPKAKIIFATHMQAARKRKLTAYELGQLSKARQVLRASRKPAMNPYERGRDYGLPSKHIQPGDKVQHTGIPAMFGTVERVNNDGTVDVKWADGDRTQEWVKQLRKRQTGPKGKLPNPKPVLIYGQVHRIEAVKTQDHLCDDECKKFGHRYFHNFKSRPKMYGLPDGSLLIK